jgi:hypothetical protein
MRAEHRCRAPEAEYITHWLRNLDLALHAHFLHDQGHGEERRQIVRTDGLQGPRMQDGGRRLGQVGLNVVPEAWHLAFFQQVLRLMAHGCSSDNVYR